MADPSTTTQQPSLKWYKLQGADGKWYKTQAYSPDHAKAKVSSATNTIGKGFTDNLGYSDFNMGWKQFGKETAQNIGNFISGAAKDYDPIIKKNPIEGAVLETLTLPEHIMAKGIEGLAGGVEKSAKDIATPGKRMYGVGEFIGSAGQILAGAEGREGGSLLTKAGRESTAEGLRGYADKVYSKKLGVKPQDVPTEPGLHAAKEVGAAMHIDTVRQALQQKVDEIGKQLDPLAEQAKKQGIKIRGLSQAVDKVYDPKIAEAKNIGGKAGADLVNKLIEEKKAAQSIIQTDAITGKNLHVKLDYQNGIDPVTALAKKRAIMNRGFEGSANELVKAANRQLGHAFGQIIDASIPEMRELNKKYAGLKDATDAANKRLAESKVGLTQRMTSLFQSPAALTGYLIAGMGGASWGMRYAGILGLKAIYDSLPSATLRASAAARAADIISGDRPIPKPKMSVPNKVVPPTQPPSGASPAGPTPGPGAGPGSGTPAPAASPAPAVGGSAGAGAPGVGAAPIPAAAAPASLFGKLKQQFPEASNERLQALVDKAEKVKEGAEKIASYGKDKPSVSAADNIEHLAKVTELPEDSIYHDWHKNPKFTTPESQATDKALGRVPEGQSGISAKDKKYLDMTDELMRKMETANEMNKAQYEKELVDLKKVLNPATPEAEKVTIRKRIEARGRKQASRANAAATVSPDANAVAKTEVKETGKKSFEALAQGASPEDAMIALESLYKELGKKPNGQRYVSDLKKVAKQIKMGPEEEFNSALEVYEFLNKHVKESDTE